MTGLVQIGISYAYHLINFLKSQKSNTEHFNFLSSLDLQLCYKHLSYKKTCIMWMGTKLHVLFIMISYHSTEEILGVVKYNKNCRKIVKLTE